MSQAPDEIRPSSERDGSERTHFTRHRCECRTSDLWFAWESGRQASDAWCAVVMLVGLSALQVARGHPERPAQRVREPGGGWANRCIYYDMQILLCKAHFIF